MGSRKGPTLTISDPFQSQPSPSRTPSRCSTCLHCGIMHVSKPINTVALSAPMILPSETRSILDLHFPSVRFDHLFPSSGGTGSGQQFNDPEDNQRRSKYLPDVHSQCWGKALLESCPLRLNLRKCFTEVTKFCQQIARMLAIDAGIYGRAGEMLIIDASSVLTLLGSLIRPVTGAYFLNKTKKDFF